MAESASGTAHQMMDRARQNPIPAVMVGAGVAWILIEPDAAARQPPPRRLRLVR